MTWTYDNTSLGDSTAAERINAVRLLVGDTDSSDEQVQNEEITFSLAQCNDNIYTAAAWIAGVIASKYSRRVTTELDGDLMAEYSDLAKQYRQLATQLRSDGYKYAAGSLGVKAGGISIAEIEAKRALTDRPPAFARMDRFRHPENDYQNLDYIESE